LPRRYRQTAGEQRRSALGELAEILERFAQRRISDKRPQHSRAIITPAGGHIGRRDTGVNLATAQ
jgi:hypothetical protein